MTVEALEVLSNKDTTVCKVEMVAEIFEGFYDEREEMWHGQWKEVPQSDDTHTNRMSDPAERSFDIKIDQKKYIDDLRFQYRGSTDTASIPEYTQVRYRISAWDPTDRAGTMIQEEVIVDVKSSGETKAATCNFDALSVTDSLSGVRKYSTADLGKHDGIYISSKIGGKENLNSADCEQEIFQALAIEVETGVFEQVWSENGRITNGAEVEGKYFTVQDDRIQVNINEEDFSEYQNKFSTL
jgi:hypothetical protein